MPKVSVIIPNYNHEQYLPKRIQSVLDQTFTDYEVWLLDDASTDNSRDYLTQVASEHANFQVHFNSKNTGSTFHQWNLGVSLASGDYIWLAESDDFAQPTLLENLVRLMDANPKVGIAFAQSQLVNEKDEVLHSFQENYNFVFKERAHRWETDFVASGLSEVNEYLLYSNSIPNASGALFRKSVYTQAGGAPEDMKLNGDWFFYVKMLLYSDLAYCAQPLNAFRTHAVTQRHRAKTNYKVYDEIIRTVELIRKKGDPDPKRVKETYRKIGAWWVGSLVFQNKNGEFYKENKRLYAFFASWNPGLGRKILTHFTLTGCKKVLYKMGLYSTAKRLRNQWFPGKYFEF